MNYLIETFCIVNLTICSLLSLILTFNRNILYCNPLPRAKTSIFFDLIETFCIVNKGWTEEVYRIIYDLIETFCIVN